MLLDGCTNICLLLLLSSIITIANTSETVNGLIYPEISLNYSIDPCQDLYEHVCSNWKRDHPVPSDRTFFSRLGEASDRIKPTLFELYMKPDVSRSNAINQLKQYFHACNDMESANRLKSDEFRAGIDAIGGWPLLMGSDWDSTKFNPTQLLIDIVRLGGYKVFIDFNASQDLKNVTRWLLNFDQRHLIMDTREYYLNAAYKQKLDAYRQYMTDVLWLMIEDSKSNCTENELKSTVDELIKVDIELAKLSKPKEERYDFNRLYNLKRLSDLDQMAPAINWTRYLIEISPPELLSYYVNNPPIVINEIEYIPAISNLLNRTSPRLIVDYVFWRWLHTYITYLDKRFQDIQDVFQRHLLGKKKRLPRWKECVIQTIENMDQASGAIYIRAKFEQDDFVVAKTMIEEIRTAFIHTFKTNTWVGPKIKKYALKKALELIYIVGGPEFLYNDTLLDEYYKDLSLNKNDSFARQERKLIQLEHNRRLRNLLNPPGRFTMDVSSAVVNAYNEQTNNKIIIPAAILQEPFFHKNYPRLAIFAGIGSIIGHEMGHSFDGQGRQFDMKGNLFNWWDNKTLQLFTKRAECIVDQFDGYPINNAGTNRLHINGHLTRDENLADLVGLSHAYWAYQSYLKRTGLKEEEPWPGFSNYTSDQMFFISYANILCTSMTKDQTVVSALTDPHSPSNWRINGAVSNVPQFAGAFRCSKTAPSNLQKRCVIW